MIVWDKAVMRLLCAPTDIDPAFGHPVLRQLPKE